MKIAIITRHFISNYGSLLQTFATQEIVKLLGHECVIINYIRKDEELFRREYTLLQNKKKKKKVKKKKKKKNILYFIKTARKFVCRL